MTGMVPMKTGVWPAKDPPAVVLAVVVAWGLATVMGPATTMGLVTVVPAVLVVVVGATTARKPAGPPGVFEKL